MHWQWQRRRSSEEVQGTESVAWQRGLQTVISFLHILLLVSASVGILWWPPTCRWDSGLPDRSAHSFWYKLYSITDFWKRRWRDLVLRRTPALVKCGYITLFSSFSFFFFVSLCTVCLQRWWNKHHFEYRADLQLSPHVRLSFSCVFCWIWYDS